MADTSDSDGSSAPSGDSGMSALTGGAIDDAPPVPIEVEASQRRRLNVNVLLVLSAGAAYLLGRMLWPFVPAIISAVVIAVLAHPGYRRLRRHISRESVAAMMATVLLFFLVLVPLLAVSFALFNSLQDNVDAVSGVIGDFLAPGGRARAWLDQAASWLGMQDVGLTGSVRNQIQQLGSFLAGRTVGILSGLGGGLVQAGVALFTLYYLLRDGERLMAGVRRILPLQDELTDALLERSGEIIFATMFGNVIVGIAQGTAGGLMFWALGVPGAVLWGSVMGVLGLLPVLGTPLVWVPAAIILFVQGSVVRAIIMVLIGTLIVSTIDNVLRATVVSDRAQLHPLIVFFSALGGILIFGMVGVFLGPILFVISISLLEITRHVLDPGDGHSN